MNIDAKMVSYIQDADNFNIYHKQIASKLLFYSTFIVTSNIYKGLKLKIIISGDLQKI